MTLLGARPPWLPRWRRRLWQVSCTWS